MLAEGELELVRKGTAKREALQEEGERGPSASACSGVESALEMTHDDALRHL